MIKFVEIVNKRIYKTIAILNEGGVSDCDAYYIPVWFTKNRHISNPNWGFMFFTTIIVKLCIAMIIEKK